MSNLGSELQLFSIQEFDKNSISKQELPIITESQIIIPLAEILNETAPKTEGVSTTLKQSLDDLFPEQKYDDKNIQEAKKTLGTLANEFTPEQLKDAVVEIQFLAESWLDDFEREIFQGKTITELLHEKG